MSTTVQQAPGLYRTDLQEHELSIPGRKVTQNRVRNIGGRNAAELATYVVEVVE